jgi:enoyl-CoA hydratase
MRNVKCGMRNFTERFGARETGREIPHFAFRISHSEVTIPRMNYQTLLFEIKDGIAFVTINRPDKLNALNDQVMLELADAAERIATEGEIQGAILTGAGPKSFVAGADIGDLSRQGPFDGKARAQRGQAVLRRLETCGKPVIAAINGFALGGGCELAMACHIRIASENAKFGQPEVKLGIAPGYGGTQRLPRLVGKGVALQLILTGEMIDAQEAYRIGLVNKVVPAADLLLESEKMMRGILAMGPLAVRLALEAVDQGLEMTLDEGLLLEANHFGLLAATADMKEGTTAFLEKRAAKFQGR